jgi:isopropylmalate/homocitrate/citramalate synthase
MSYDELPEYFLESLPEDAFPTWQWTDPPPHLPADVWMSETTHRDGQQGGLPLNISRSQRIYEILCTVTGESGAIRHAEFFPYHPADRKALTWALERWRDGASIEPTTWIRATPEDVALIAALGIRETGILCSASDYHTFHKFTPPGRRSAATRYLDAVSLVLDAGIRPRVHLEDTTRASADFVRTLVESLLQRASGSPPALQPRFRICDTMGIGLPYADVQLPRSVPRWVATLRELGLSADQIEFHPHNDMWLVVANCIAAVREGCGVISGTSLGTGERTGNAPLEAVMVHLMGMGFWGGDGVDLRAYNDLVALYDEVGQAPSRKYPIFGDDAFLTRAGVHADGINKFWRMYAPWNAPLLLGRDLEVALTKDSGQAGLLFVLRRRFGLELGKDDPQVTRILGWMEEQFADGRETAIAWQELTPLLDAAPVEAGE